MTGINKLSDGSKEIVRDQKGRVMRATSVSQVIDETTIDVGYSEHHPKEPGAVYDPQTGTFYVVCAVWDNYDFTHDRKCVVLCSSSSYDSGFSQISTVSPPEADPHGHSPGIYIDSNRELWIFHGVEGADPHSIAAKHAPLSNIPSDPSGWTDEGYVVTNSARDPAVFKQNGTYYMLYVESSHTLRRVESTDLVNWSNKTTVYTDGMGEGADLVPKANGDGLWLVNAAQDPNDSNDRWQIVGEGSSLTDSFSGKIDLFTKHDISGLQQPFFDGWNLHYDYTFLPEAEPKASKFYKTNNGEFVAFFEGGTAVKGQQTSSDQFSVGVVTFRDSMNSAYKRVPDGTAEPLTWYPMTGSGSTLNDEGGDAQGTVTDTNNIVFSRGGFGQTLDFNTTANSGANGVTFDVTKWPTGTSSFTTGIVIENTTDTANQVLTIWGAPSSSSAVGLGLRDTGDIRLTCWGNDYDVAPPYPYIRGRKFIAASYDSSTGDYRLFYDRQFIGSTSVSTNIGTNDAAVGGNPFDSDNGAFNGNAHFFFVDDRAWSESELATLREKLYSA